MSENALKICPCCGAKLETGFAHKAIGLSFVAPEKMNRFISIDEDLASSGLRKFLPSKAEYFRSYLCRACELYLIDYGTTIGHGEAKQMAQLMTREGNKDNIAEPS